MREILFENAYWIVTPEGLESKRVEGWHEEHVGWNGGYLIETCRLQEPDWIDHMTEKTWVSPVPFVEAYYQAIKILLGIDFDRNVPALLPDGLSELYAKPYEGIRLYTAEELFATHKERMLYGDRTPRALVFVNENHAIQHQCKELLDVWPQLKGDEKFGKDQ